MSVHTVNMSLPKWLFCWRSALGQYSVAKAPSPCSRNWRTLGPRPPACFCKYGSCHVYASPSRIGRRNCGPDFSKEGGSVTSSIRAPLIQPGPSLQHQRRFSPQDRYSPERNASARQGSVPSPHCSASRCNWIPELHLSLRRTHHNPASACSISVASFTVLVIGPT